MVAIRIPGAESIDPVAPARDPGVTASPEAFGSQIGTSEVHFGDAVSSLGALLYKKQEGAQDHVYTQGYQVDFAPAAEQARIDNRAAFPNGGPGTVEDLNQRLYRADEQTRAGLAQRGLRPSDNATRQVDGHFAGVQSNMLVSGVTYSNNANVEHLKTQTDATVNSLSASVLAGTVPVEDALKQVDAIAAGSGALFPGGTIDAWKRSAQTTIQRAAIQSAIEAKDATKARELQRQFFGDAPMPGQSEADESRGGIYGAIYAQESGSGRNTQTSITGARGGMQIQPATFKQYAHPGENINNKADNLAVGRRIIDDLSEKSDGDPARIAVGYFSGPGNIAPPGSPTPWKVDRADPTGKTTSSYVSDVMRRLNPANPNASLALEYRNKIDSMDAVNRRDTTSAIADDLASMSTTGQGDPKLTPDTITRSLGPNASADWLTARARAKDFYDKTQDFYALPEGEMTARVEALKPKPGQEEFVAQQKIYTEAQKKADAVLVVRQNDPAASVINDPEVKDAVAKGATMDDPEKLKPLMSARLAAQTRAGIPPDAQSPITKSEALTLTVPLRRMLPGQERQTLMDMGKQFQELFGAEADSAFAYALRIHKVDAATAQAATQVMKKLALGTVPGAATTYASDRTSEQDAAKAATGPTSASVPVKAIRDLRTDPKLASEFDTKYGKGTSKAILDNYPTVYP